MQADKTYSTGAVAKRIGVEPVTVRKYAQMLEGKGYEFQKDQKGWRSFSERDLQALEHLMILRNNGVSVEESIQSVANLYHQNLTKITTDTTIQKHESELKNFINSQMALNQKIIERLDSQEERQVERDQNLMIALREILDAKQIASTSQEKWWQFWK